MVLQHPNNGLEAEIRGPRPGPLTSPLALLSFKIGPPSPLCLRGQPGTFLTPLPPPVSITPQQGSKRETYLSLTLIFLNSAKGRQGQSRRGEVGTFLRPS